MGTLFLNSIEKGIRVKIAVLKILAGVSIGLLNHPNSLDFLEILSNLITSNPGLLLHLAN